MREWIAGYVGENMASGAMLVVVTMAFVLAFVVLLAIFRSFLPTGIRGNRRTRHARLAVMDAAAVDSRRKLVLVRRDNVEHLLMIGGPSDVVVEHNIIRQLQVQPGQTAPQRAAAQRPPSQLPPDARQQPPDTPRPQRAPTAASPNGSGALTAPRAPKGSVAPAAARKPVSTTPVPPLRPEPTRQPPPSPPNTGGASGVPNRVNWQQLAAKPRPKPSPSMPSEQSKPTPPVAVSSPITPASRAPAPVNRPGSMVRPIAASAPAVASINPPRLSPEHPRQAQNSPAPLDNKGELATFDEELAMELGETILADDNPVSDKNLSRKLNDLLSEINNGNNSKN